MLSNTDIVKLIQTKISIKKQGKNFIAHCPFHDEKNPSFTISPEKQFYYCFSCTSHGNAIDFLMHYDQLTFIESIKILAETNGISITQYTNKHLNNETKKNNLYQFMNNLCLYYQNNLINKKYIHAYNYLKKRGLNTTIITEFNIGFAPSESNNITNKFNNTTTPLYNQEILNQSGMLVHHTNHKYDLFRNRIMFPIRNISGKIIAFGGRTIITNQKIPKYLNSPDTEIFKKSQHLYGLYEAHLKCKNIANIILVEGYIDVISLTQFGINYAVASLGTSTTKYHIQSLYNITNKIICCYDGDHAGTQAAWRTLKNVLPYLTDNREIHFMFLPKGEDPDTLIRKIGKKHFLKKLTQTQDLSYFLFNTLSQKINLQTLAGRIKLSKLIIPILNKIPSKILKIYLSQQLGAKIGILDENKLNQLLTKKYILTNNFKKHHINYNIEHILIGLLIQHPKLIKYISTTQGLKQYNNHNITIFKNLIHICKKYSISTSAQLLEYYRHDPRFSKIEAFAYWNHMIANNMIEITFIDALIKLYNSILEERQTILINKDRTIQLTQKERSELWLINKTLSNN